jgi:hypothetical protein
MEKEMKEWIDNADYESLLRKWRFAPVGDVFFQGELGKYYSDAMFKKRNELNNAEQVRTSKTIGWEH